jgi:hypothetical protein
MNIEAHNMTKNDLSRRRMIAAGAGIVGAQTLRAQAGAVVTVGEVIARIKKTSASPGWNKR